jgi:hypothetical protein
VDRSVFENGSIRFPTVVYTGNRYQNGSAKTDPVRRFAAVGALNSKW